VTWRRWQDQLKAWAPVRARYALYR
jgi:hypothetical protein